MKNLKIALSIATLFMASHAVQATELKEQPPTNQQALYQLDVQPLYQGESKVINLFSCSGGFPDCQITFDNANLTNQSLNTQAEPTE